jgi:homoserine dehydrogenase
MVWAKEFDCRIKLIASVRKNEETGALFAAVYPAILPLTDVVANVNEVYNAVSLTGDVVGRTVHIGRGAGQDATASAVIADIADAIAYLQGKPVRPALNVVAEKSRMATLEEVSDEFYLRMEVPDRSGVLASVASDLAGEGISVELLQQRKHETEGKAWLLFTTHKTTEEAIKRACEKLKQADYVFDEPFVLRIWKSE